MMIPIIIFAALAIALIVFLIKSADTWNWVQITMVALIFVTSIFGGVMASRSMKTRQAWIDRYNKNVEKIAELEKGYAEAVFGPDDTVDGYGEGSLRDVTFREQMSQLGQGRIWYNGRVTQNGETFSLTFNDENKSISPAMQLRQDMILFAFGDKPFDIDGQLTSFAADFMGSFRVASADGANNQVVLEPLFEAKQLRVGTMMRGLAAKLTQAAADPEQAALERMKAASELAMELNGDERTEFDAAWQAVATGGAPDALVTWLNDKATSREPQGSWALFEKMPGDSREVFRDHMGLERWEEATPEILGEYREALRTTYLPADLLGMDPESKEYEALLDTFNFDGVRMNVITQFVTQNANQRVVETFDPPVENIWGEIRFENKSESFTVNGQGSLNNDGVFDFSGATNDPRLKHPDDQITFSKDDVILVPKQWGKDGFDFGENKDRQPPIIETSDAVWLETEYYFRPVRDYPFRLNRYLDLARRALEKQRIVLDDLDVTTQMQNDTQAQVEHRDDMLTKLAADIDRMKADLSLITQLREQREAELKEKREKVRTYYNQIIELYKNANANSAEDGFLDTRVRRQPTNRSFVHQDR